MMTAGMILFARMDAMTRRGEVLSAMLIAGFGMGLLMPVYTVAIQNAASREHMGAASALPTFFRSIGSTVGVAIFGTVLLTNYQRDFAKGVPAGTRGESSEAVPESADAAADACRNWTRCSASTPGGPALLKTLLGNVRDRRWCMGSI